MVNFTDEAGIKAAIADVRNDASDTNWVVAAHDAIDTVSLRGSGSGGLEELKTALQGGEIAFGLLRVTNKFDDSITVKFVYIHWLGPEVKMITKGRSAIHRGDIEAIFSPFHVSIVDQSSLDELTEDTVMTRVQDVAGTRSHVTERKEGDQERGFTQTSTERRTKVPEPSRTEGGSGDTSSTTTTATAAAPASTSEDKPKPVPKPALRPPAVTSQGASVTFADEVRDALKAVRSDTDATNWAIATYVEGGVTEVRLLGKGEGGIEEMNTHFTPDMVAYALFRTTEQIDDTVAVKFGHISWIGDNFKPLLRAKVSTHRSAVRDVFEPFHVEFAGISQVDEVTPEIIARAIGQASGTLSHVK